MRIETPLETPRLRLATLTEDAAAGPYLGWMRDEVILRFLDAKFADHDEASLRAFIRGINDDDRELFLGMFLKEDGRHIGNIRLGPIHPRISTPMGVLVGDRSLWGQGYASEAIAAVCAYAAEALEVHHVTACYCPDNAGSGKAFLNAGFEPEGRLRHHWFDGEGWSDMIVLGRILRGPDGAAGASREGTP